MSLPLDIDHTCWRASRTYVAPIAANSLPPKPVSLTSELRCPACQYLRGWSAGYAAAKEEARRP